jgi:dihydroorotate dehydrogenase
MIDIYPCLRPLLMVLEPERAHQLTLLALKTGLGPVYRNNNESLKIRLWNREFQNPLGIAAGFDKDAEVIAPLFRMGFGFVEAGTVTPLPQTGNDRPRIFRDAANESVINRMGFPGHGLEAFAENVADFRRRFSSTSGILGVNIGINKGTAAPVQDYRLCMDRLAPLANYITINVSSPNTAGLRQLQEKESLDRLLAELLAVRQVPVLLKIAPDMEEAQRAEIANVALRHRIDGLIISNTTVMRPAALRQDLQNEKGGLSGRLLRDISTGAIRDFYRLTQGAIPIIGVGGISSAADAYEKIRAGASLVQIYTALVYRGPAIITRILEGLATLLKQDGFQHVAEAVGSETTTGKAKAKAVI